MRSRFCVIAASFFPSPPLRSLPAAGLVRFRCFFSGNAFSLYTPSLYPPRCSVSLSTLRRMFSRFPRRLFSRPPTGGIPAGLVTLPILPPPKFRTASSLFPRLLCGLHSPVRRPTKCSHQILTRCVFSPAPFFSLRKSSWSSLPTLSLFRLSWIHHV